MNMNIKLTIKYKPSDYEEEPPTITIEHNGPISQAEFENTIEAFVKAIGISRRTAQPEVTLKYGN